MLYQIIIEEEHLNRILIALNLAEAKCLRDAKESAGVNEWYRNASKNVAEKYNQTKKVLIQRKQELTDLTTIESTTNRDH